MKVCRVGGDTIILVACSLLYLCLVSKNQHYTLSGKNELQKVSDEAAVVVTSSRYNSAVHYVNFCQATIVTAFIRCYIDLKSEKESFLPKSNLKDDGKKVDVKVPVDAFDVSSSSGDMKTRNSNNFRNRMQWTTTQCNTSSCISYLYCFENNQSNIRCFDFRVKHSVKKTDLRKGLVDYGRFLKPNKVNWQREYVGNYQLVSGNYLNASSDGSNSNWKRAHENEIHPTNSSQYLLVLYCSPMHNSTVIHCLDIKMPRKDIIGYYEYAIPMKENTNCNIGNKEKCCKQTYFYRSLPLGFCLKTKFHNGSTILDSSMQCLLITKENQTSQHNPLSTGCLVKEGGSGCLETLLYLVFAISCVGNTVFILRLRNPGKETVTKDWDNRRELEGALRYQKDLEDRQRRHDNMVLGTEKRGHVAILNLLRSYSLPLKEETRTFNEWLQSPD